MQFIYCKKKFKMTKIERKSKENGYNDLYKKIIYIAQKYRYKNY